MERKRLLSVLGLKLYDTFMETKIKFMEVVLGLMEI